MNLPHSPRSGSALLLSLIAAAGLSATSLFAQSVTTEAVGAMSVTVPANSDALVSAPLSRPAVFTGSIASISGNVLTVNGSPSWTNNQFVYVQGTQPETYSLQIKSGAKRGAFFTVTANSANSLTIDLNGDSLAGVSASDQITVTPYWTLGTLFPAGGGFPGSPSFTPVGEIQFANVTSAGTNLASTAQYYYYTGTAGGGAGWRRVGQAPTLKFDNTVLYPDVPYRVRNRAASSATLVNVGTVPYAGHYSQIGTLQNGLAQDNFVTLMSGADTTLQNSGLISSGAFTGSPSFTPVDSLLVFDNSTTGLNKAPSATYFYYSGSAGGGPGWRKVGQPPTLKFDSQVLKSQEGFIIRKAANPSAQLVTWNFVPSY